MNPRKNLKVLMVAQGSLGDLHPLLGIARFMSERGHEVKLLGSGAFEKLVRAAGIDFQPTGTPEEYETVANDPDLWHPRRGFQVLVRTVSMSLERCYQAIKDSYVPGRTVLVSTAMALGARVAQEKLGIPGFTVHLSPGIMRSVVDPPKMTGLPIAPWQPLWLRRTIFWMLDNWVIDRMLAKPLNAFRKTLGMGPVRGIFREWINSPQGVIGLFPDWFCPPAPDWPKPFVLTGFPLYDEKELTAISPELDRFLEDGDAPIAFTPGSAMRRGKEFFEAAVKACLALNRRGLLLSRYSEHLPRELPPTVRHVDYAPFSVLLPRCAAIVHHGGIGTAAQGLAAGIPHVVMCMAHDQLDNACRLEGLGVAAVLPEQEFTPVSLRAALDRVLHSPRIAEECASVRARFSGQNYVAQTVDWIEKEAVPLTLSKN